LNIKANNIAASNQYHHLIEVTPLLFWFPLSKEGADGEVEVKGPAIFGDDELDAAGDDVESTKPPGFDEGDPPGVEEGDPPGVDDTVGAAVPDAGGVGVARVVGADVFGLVVDAG